MRPMVVLLAAALTFALVAGCASPARESSGGGDADDGTGECSGNVCRDTIEVTDPDGTGNATNKTDPSV